jgi:hypothetical protein
VAVTVESADFKVLYAASSKKIIIENIGGGCSGSITITLTDEEGLSGKYSFPVTFLQETPLEEEISKVINSHSKGNGSQKSKVNGTKTSGEFGLSSLTLEIKSSKVSSNGEFYLQFSEEVFLLEDLGRRELTTLEDLNKKKD